ncbi:MAG: MFS transporter [Deltaproteobacteria bacterium]|nr:MFS transporter [Deltaproteobacteria bacterium]MBW2694965.1 MFS transporter [Deltaproteobacteria bacterium]
MSPDSQHDESSSKSASVGSREAPLSLWVVTNYNLPTVGVGFMFLLVNIYLMKFATDELLVPASAMGMIFGLSRIWDALTDPLAGYWSDRTQTAMGRRRPWILASVIPIGLAFYMIWNPPVGLQGSALIAWMGVGVFLFYTSMTIVIVPHTSLGAELSIHHHERTRIFGARHVMWSVGSFVAIGAMGLMISSDEPRALASQISVVAAIVTGILLVWMVASVRERVEYQGRGESKPFKAFADVLRNRHARLLLIVFLIESLGGATIGVLTPYVSEYIIGTPEKTPLYIMVYAVPSAASVPFWVAMSRRFGKKRLWILSMLVTAFGFGAMFFLQEGDVVPITILAFLLGIGAGAGAVVAPSIEADVIDYDELETGQRKEGAYFAAWNFVFKSATGVTLMLTGFVLEMSGFVPNEIQSEDAKLALLSLYALFPMACYLLGTLIFTRFSLDEAEHARIRRALDERAGR